MNHSVILKRSLPLLLSGVALVIVLILGSRSDFGSIIIEKPGVTVNGVTVENGTAFDKAELSLEGYRKVLLPETFSVVRKKNGTTVRLLLTKTLAFHGHPPEAMSIRSARKMMGCAFKVEGEVLVLASFGEWDSHKEGRAHMQVVAILPEEMQVEQREGLSAELGTSLYLARPEDAKGGYWYGAASPTHGWTRIPDSPDRFHSARH